MPAQRPTLEWLATELGVSRQTVPNVLNRPSVVAEATRQRVAAAISAAGYAPSRAGRHLRTHRSHAIGIRLMPTFDDINGHIGDTFHHELAEHAHRSDYRLAARTSVALLVSRMAGRAYPSTFCFDRHRCSATPRSPHLPPRNPNQPG